MRYLCDLSSGYLRSLTNQKGCLHTCKLYDQLFIFKGKLNLSNRNFSTGKFEVSSDWKKYRETSRSLLSAGAPSSKYSYDPKSLTTLPRTYEAHLTEDVKFRNWVGLNPLFTHYVNPFSIVKFTAKYLLSYRFFFIYMARTTFQVRGDPTKVLGGETTAGVLRVRRNHEVGAGKP